MGIVLHEAAYSAGPASFLLLEPAVLSCNRAARDWSCMNVTLKLSDDVVREARHEAIDENTSLSALVEQLLREDPKEEKPSAKSSESGGITAFAGRARMVR